MAKFTQAQLDEIQRTQETRSLTRKAAVQFCTRLWKRQATEAAKPANATAPAKTKAARKTKAPAKRVSDRAAQHAKDTAKAVALYKACDKTLTDIAERVTGKPRGNGLNYCRALLIKAKVWKGAKQR